MRKASSKALYLFLCSILGMILLTMLHRALFVLYDILLGNNFAKYSFGLSTANIAMLDFVTMLVALFLGGWYGTVMGLDWYALVYGPNVEHKAGLFHGFVPHNWRKKNPAKNKSQSVATMPVVETPVKVPVRESIREWSFDDFLNTKEEPKKRVVRKTVAKKTVRKTAIRKPKVISE